LSVLSAWDSFYIIVGPAAGALIGLQFVVMTLMADRPSPTLAEAGRSFATPTVTHFAACLLVAALVRVPWPAAVVATSVCGAIGVCGLIYMCVLVRRMRRQNVYNMDNEDRIFHVVLPFFAYGVLTLSGFLALSRFELALFGIGLASLILLFDGIHNAWDAVAYQVLVMRGKPEPPTDAIRRGK
ncbi:MAG TPA: hypothetical protein VJ476_03515, partial [Rhizomicrobium sp.]|nr:hypothetical protein [Rhizomicrobium sp.]